MLCPPKSKMTSNIVVDYNIKPLTDSVAKDPRTSPIRTRTQSFNFTIIFRSIFRGLVGNLAIEVAIV